MLTLNRFAICIAVLSAVVGLAACSRQQSESVPVGLQTPAVTADMDVATLRRLANQGNPEAQYVLGDRYQYGKGVKPDNTQAVAWYQKAADQGLADGQAGLAIMYELGLGVPKDSAQAVAWFQKSADQGDARAQRNLGFIYRDGQGVAQDYAEAHKWLNLAAARALPTLQSTYAEPRDALAEEMTSAQLTEAQKRAADWQAAFEQRQAD